MKKLIAILAALMLMGCGNSKIFGTTWHYDYAYITLPEGVVEGEVKSWTHYDYCDIVQVTMEDGTTYYTHSSNVILIGKEEDEHDS